MLKLKLQYFGLDARTNSFEKTLSWERLKVKGEEVAEDKVVR